MIGHECSDRGKPRRQFGLFLGLDQPEVAFKSHAMKHGVPRGGRVPGFEVMLKALLKQNYVVREDNIYVINTAHPPMDHDKVNAVNNMFRGRFWRMKALVDSAEEYLL